MGSKFYPNFDSHPLFKYLYCYKWEKKNYGQICPYLWEGQTEGANLHAGKKRGFRYYELGNDIEKKKFPANFLQTSYGLPADFPDFTTVFAGAYETHKRQSAKV